MPWFWLALAGLLEVVWAVGLKMSDGFSRLSWSLATVATLVSSFVFLGAAVKSIPIGTAYAVWTGIGAVGVALCGMMLFGESKEGVRIFFILLIVTGIAGLKLSAP